ncbi:alcohol dehydrogenase [Anaerolineae bacterium CFX9]|nr:alcohol dehydrogenase [Anaerolineae bacterium CFX9]
MRALVYTDTLQLRTDVSQPEPKPDQALLRIRKAGVCNTDLELMAGYYNFKGIPGHEFVADVVSGSQPDMLGRRVVGEINVACGECDFCRRGIPTQCRNRASVGIRRHDGAFADYLALAARNLHVVPDEVSDDEAVFTEPLAAALQILEMVHVKPSDRVVLIGAGKLGMLCAQVLRQTTAHLVCVIRREKQAKMLNRWGIDAVSRSEVADGSAQIVVDCTGNAGGIAEAIHMVEPRGTIVLKSTYVGRPEVDLSWVAVKELHVVGSRCGPFDAALRLLKEGRVDVLSMIEARYSLDEGVSAIEHAADAGRLKVLIEMQSAG